MVNADDPNGEWLRSLADGMIVEDAPGWVTDGAVASFRARTGATVPRRPGWVERLRTVVAYDSWSAAPTLALRGAGRDDTRHLVYAVDQQGAEVAVSVYATSGDAVAVVGHVMTPDGDATYLVDALVGDATVASTTTSASGEFSFEGPSDWTEIVVVGVTFELSLPAAPEHSAR